MNFEFATAARILFGPGRLPDIGPIAASLGRHALLVTGRTPERARPVLDALAAQGVDCCTFPVAGEQTLDDAAAGVQQARQAGCDMVIGFGGGSALDTGKAVAALLTNGGQPLDYVEVIGRGRALAQPSAPYIAIPTTAGTGAEVTRNAVLASPQHAVKVSLRSPHMLPRLALVDPLLTLSLPPDITASTGLDALTQLIEPYVSKRANPITRSLCREGLARAARSLQRACENGTDAAAREDMALASLLSGLALANSGLGAAHGLAGPLGGMLPAPHGAVCARLLPHVMAVNLRALRQRAPHDPALEAYREVACLLCGRPGAQAEDGLAWVQALCETLQVPPLSAYGLARADFQALADKAAAASSMQANPIQLSHQELIEILEHAL